MATAGLYRRFLSCPPAVEFASSQGKVCTNSQCLSLHSVIFNSMLMLLLLCYFRTCWPHLVFFLLWLMLVLWFLPNFWLNVQQLFLEAIQNGNMEGFYRLVSYFQTQSEPAYCGLASLSMVLNALAIDPGRKWKGMPTIESLLIYIAKFDSSLIWYLSIFVTLLIHPLSFQFSLWGSCKGDAEAVIQSNYISLVSTRCNFLPSPQPFCSFQLILFLKHDNALNSLNVMNTALGWKCPCIRRVSYSSSVDLIPKNFIYILFPPTPLSLALFCLDLIECSYNLLIKQLLFFIR